jgi:hypothetical protein
MLSGLTQEDIALDDVIRLYINHRPINALSSNEIDDTFNAIRDRFKYVIYLLLFIGVNNLNVIILLYLCADWVLRAQQILNGQIYIPC